MAGLAGKFEPGGFPVGAPAEVVEGRVVGMGDVLGVPQDRPGALHRRVQGMVFFFDGVFGLGLFLVGGVGGLEIGIKVISVKEHTSLLVLLPSFCVAMTVT